MALGLNDFDFDAGKSITWAIGRDFPASKSLRPSP
jgi:hypothetical protein